MEERTIYASLDRIENGIAILLADDGTTVEMPCARVPDAAEGGVYLLWQKEDITTVLYRDKDEEKTRRERVSSLLSSLMKDAAQSENEESVDSEKNGENDHGN